jgi:small subunit ribosomal protein S15
MASVTAALSIASGSTQSVENQIVMLTADITDIANYLQSHPKDYSKRRGLLSKVSRRRQLLDYLRSQSLERYKLIIDQLRLMGIRK